MVENLGYRGFCDNILDTELKAQSIKEKMIMCTSKLKHSVKKGC